MNNIVTPPAPLFLNGSSLSLQVTSSTIKSWMGSKFVQIRSWTAEVAALERLEKSPYTYNWRNVVHSSAFIFGWIFFILAGNKDNYNS